VRTYSKLLEEFPNYGDYLWGVRESYSRLVNLLKSTGRSQDATAVSGQAIAFYEKLRTRYPQSVLFRADLGKAYGLRAAVLQGAGRPREAVQDFRKAAALLEKARNRSHRLSRPDLLAGYYAALGELLMREAKLLKEAETAYRRALILYEKLAAQSLRRPDLGYNWQLYQTRVNLIGLLNSSGRDSEAKTVARQAVTFWDRLASANPDLVDCSLNLAQSHELAEEWDKALAGYSKAIQQAPKRWETWHLRGNVQVRLKRWDSALADFSRAIALAPPGDGALPWSYGGRSNAYLGLQQPDKALADLTKATELWPKLYDVWAWRAGFYRDRQQWDKAAADFSKVIELNPTCWAWFDRAIAHVQLKKPDRAVADLREAIKKGLPNAEQTLKNDARFETLRSREDFKALLTGLQKKTKKQSSAR
jgi:tetratricopeptide (TPR) repeat protein